MAIWWDRVLLISRQAAVVWLWCRVYVTDSIDFQPHFPL
jgi:hypothetical protein